MNLAFAIRQRLSRHRVLPILLLAGLMANQAVCAGSPVVETQRGHHFAAGVNRHVLALPWRCRRVCARLVADHQPLCFRRRQDRASHRSG